jgi:hypothetical protein
MVDGVADDDPPATVELSLHVTTARGDPIAGDLRSGSGQVWRFAGWLELSTVIEAARTADS